MIETIVGDPIDKYVDITKDITATKPKLKNMRFYKENSPVEQCIDPSDVWAYFPFALASLKVDKKS
jgi:hypothetical protein